MSRFRSRLAIATAALAIAPCLAAPVVPNSDPLAAIDLNRKAIVADIVKGLGSWDAALLKSRLEKLRADRLLAASLASTPESLEAIVAEGESAALPAFAAVSAKTFGDANRDLLYTPMTPCRLIDTRGFSAPIQGGPFGPGERRSYAPGGLCGIPSAGVATILISFTTQNLTPNSGGYLAILAPSAPVNTVVDVFNFGSEWSASNTAVATGSAGQFDVYVSTATAQVVIDVLGYFAKSGNIDLAPSTATTGNILKSGVRFIHDTGDFNAYIGREAGNFTNPGMYNVGIGAWALLDVAGGVGNVANGYTALTSNTSGTDNTAVGNGAMYNNNTGNGNTALGAYALSGSHGVSYNVAIGYSALSNASAENNTAVGALALNHNTTGSSNIALGLGAGSSLTTGNYNIAIGNPGVADESFTIRIGSPSNQNRAFIAGVRGVTTINNNAVAVLIDSAGQLGTVSSSRRVKNDIADMGEASSALMKLRPVTFHYRSDQAPEGRRLQYGLIAEEVADVYPGLVARLDDGQVETVMYQFLAPMLLNEFQKQQRAIRALQQEIADLRQQAAQMARLIEQRRSDSVTAGLVPR